MKPSGDGEIFIIVPVSAYDVQCKPKKGISPCISLKANASSTGWLVSKSGELFQEYDFVPWE